MYQGYTQPTLFEKQCQEHGRDPQIEADRIQAYHQLEAQECECLRNPLRPWRLAWMCGRCKRMYEIEDEMDWLEIPEVFE